MQEQEILDAPAKIKHYDQIEAGLAELRSKYGKVHFDVTTTAGFDDAKKARAAVREPRYELEKIRKALKAPALEYSKRIDSEAKRIETELLKIEEPLDLAIKSEELRREEIKRAKEAAELARQQAIQARINVISMCVAQAVGKSSTDILALRDELADTPISLELYEHRTGEATALHAETSAKLEELYNAALAQEQEQARLAAERAELERLRQEQEAQAKAAREAEEKRIAEARAALEAEQKRLQAERDAENARQEAARAEQRRREEEAATAARQREEEAAAALRAQQEALERERRAFEEQQAAARRAEQERQEAAERAARDRQEAEARAAREKEETERRAAEEANRAEIRAARMAPEHTGGNWSVGKGGCVVTDAPIPGITQGSGHDEIEYYGGHLIAESVFRPADSRLLAAAPRMVALIKLIVEQVTEPANANHTLSAFAHGARIAEASALIAELSMPFKEPTTV